MHKQNPLRISSESLNLDDIISDLNEQQPIVSQKPITKKPTVTKQQSTRLTSAKENTNTQNKPNKIKQEVINEQKKDFQISTTIETDKDHQPSQRYGDSNFKSQFENSTQAQEEVETVASSSKFNVHHQQQEVPFYMQRQNISSTMSTITDEDVESFQKKLDTLIINFRSETMSEFMKTKKQVLSEQAQAIDAERRRCNTLLGVKQNEIEQLKESLGTKTKMCDELQARCEGMSFWAGKSKMLLRIKLLQHKSFEGLKAFAHFKKHSKKMLVHKLAQYRENLKRKAFLGWEKQYKEWKIVKNREDFERAVKQELQTICAQYNKEIESLRDKLNEANVIVDQEMKNKSMMQQNLKKAFMKGVCALNFEAMNILTPGDAGFQMSVEQEMEKQVMLAMNGGISSVQSQYSDSSSKPTYQQQPSYQQYQQQRPPQFTSFQDTQYSDLSSEQTDRRFMQIDSQADLDYKKIESKDSLWKPAPIMGRDLSQQAPTFTYSQPQITSNLRSTQQSQSYVLPSHFNKVNSDVHMNNMHEQVQVRAVHEDTHNRSQVVEPMIQNSSLPDFMSNGLPQVNHNQSVEGKTIFAGTQGAKPTQKTAATGVKKTTTLANKKK